MRILFMGTGDIGVPCLQMLLDSAWEVCGIVTQPDRPVGRKQLLTPSKPKELAMAAGLPIFQPEKLQAKGVIEEFAGLEPDVIVVVAYGQILPKAVLQLPKIACINVHASLLPRHRGAACVQAPIVAGDEESGVTIMHVAKGLDTGDIILSRKVTIGVEETGGELHDRLREIAPDALCEALQLLESGEASRLVQNESFATYAGKLLRHDGELDWSLSAKSLQRIVRAYEPWPGTYTQYRDGKRRDRRLKIFPRTEVVDVSLEKEPGTLLSWDETGIVVACGEKALQLLTVQPEGSRKLSVGEFLQGNDFQEGASFFSLAKED